MMDETLTGTEEYDIPDNELPDLVDSIPEPSLITSNGFKYYDSNDITSWLHGFNVFVLAVDETVTELKETITELQKELEEVKKKM